MLPDEPFTERERSEKRVDRAAACENDRTDAVVALQELGLREVIEPVDGAHVGGQGLVDTLIPGEEAAAQDGQHGSLTSPHQGIQSYFSLGSRI